jgi:hypothetical protein
MAERGLAAMADHSGAGVCWGVPNSQPLQKRLVQLQAPLAAAVWFLLNAVRSGNVVGIGMCLPAPPHTAVMTGIGPVCLVTGSV